MLYPNKLGGTMKKIISYLVCFVFLFVAAESIARVKVIQKADKSYDFKKVKAIVVLPMTSNGVEYGKVDPKRLPKVKSILRKTKTNMRKDMVVGSRNAKTTIPFYYKAPNRRSTTLLMKHNFIKFDNGNAATRNLTFGGSAVVEINVKLIDAKTKKIVAEVKAKGKSKGGFVGGGLDSEVLWHASKIANSDVYKYLKKLTGLKYNFVSGITKGTKQGAKQNADVMKEEKKEKGFWKRKKGK